MKIQQTNEFAKVVKKLPKQQKTVLDNAVRFIVENPLAGEMKIGDLAGVRVYKFKMNKQEEALLAYEYNENTVTLFLLKLGSHENFFRDLKRSD